MTIEFGRGVLENPDDPFHGDDVGTSLVVVTGLGGEGGSRGDDPGPAAGGLPHDDSSTAAHVHEALVPRVPYARSTVCMSTSSAAASSRAAGSCPNGHAGLPLRAEMGLLR